LKSGGDREWGERVRKAGYYQLYAEDACVLHPARRTMREIYRKIWRVEIGRQDLQRERGDSFPERVLDWTTYFLPPIRSVYRIGRNREIGSLRRRLGVIGVLVLSRIYRARALLHGRVAALARMCFVRRQHY
jgi:hypothetical protein